jgi:hypothetical protein
MLTSDLHLYTWRTAGACALESIPTIGAMLRRMLFIALADKEVAEIAQALRAYAWRCEKDLERNKGTSSEPIFREALESAQTLLAKFEAAQHAVK